MYSYFLSFYFVALTFATISLFFPGSFFPRMKERETVLGARDSGGREGKMTPPSPLIRGSEGKLWARNVPNRETLEDCVIMY